MSRQVLGHDVSLESETSYGTGSFHSESREASHSHSHSYSMDFDNGNDAEEAAGTVLQPLRDEEEAGPGVAVGRGGGSGGGGGLDVSASESWDEYSQDFHESSVLPPSPPRDPQFTAKHAGIGAVVAALRAKQAQAGESDSDAAAGAGDSARGQSGRGQFEGAERSVPRPGLGHLIRHLLGDDAASEYTSIASGASMSGGGHSDRGGTSGSSQDARVEESSGDMPAAFAEDSGDSQAGGGDSGTGERSSDANESRTTDDSDGDESVGSTSSYESLLPGEPLSGDVTVPDVLIARVRLKSLLEIGESHIDDHVSIRPNGGEVFTFGAVERRRRARQPTFGEGTKPASSTPVAAPAQAAAKETFLPAAPVPEGETDAQSVEQQHQPRLHVPRKNPSAYVSYHVQRLKDKAQLQWLDEADATGRHNAAVSPFAVLASAIAEARARVEEDHATRVEEESAMDRSHAEAQDAQWRELLGDESGSHVGAGTAHSRMQRYPQQVIESSRELLEQFGQQFGSVPELSKETDVPAPTSVDQVVAQLAASRQLTRDLLEEGRWMAADAEEVPDVPEPEHLTVAGRASTGAEVPTAETEVAVSEDSVGGVPTLLPATAASSGVTVPSDATTWLHGAAQDQQREAAAARSNAHAWDEARLRNNATVHGWSSGVDKLVNATRNRQDLSRQQQELHRDPVSAWIGKLRGEQAPAPESRTQGELFGMAIDYPLSDGRRTPTSPADPLGGAEGRTDKAAEFDAVLDVGDASSKFEHWVRARELKADLGLEMYEEGVDSTKAALRESADPVGGAAQELRAQVAAARSALATPFDPRASSDGGAEETKESGAPVGSLGTTEAVYDELAARVYAHEAATAALRPSSGSSKEETETEAADDPDAEIPGEDHLASVLARSRALRREAASRLSEVQLPSGHVEQAVATADRSLDLDTSSLADGANASIEYDDLLHSVSANVESYRAVLSSAEAMQTRVPQTHHEL